MTPVFYISIKTKTGKINFTIIIVVNHPFFTSQLTIFDTEILFNKRNETKIDCLPYRNKANLIRLIFRIKVCLFYFKKENVVQYNIYIDCIDILNVNMYKTSYMFYLCL